MFVSDCRVVYPLTRCRSIKSSDGRRRQKQEGLQFQVVLILIADREMIVLFLFNFINPVVNLSCLILVNRSVVLEVQFRVSN